MISINRLDPSARVQIIQCLCDGVSIRGTSRITGVSKNTVTKLLVELGAVCSEYMDKAFRNLQCRRFQVDEIWSYVGTKDKNVPEEKRDQFGIGSVWTWTSLDADTKLIPSWRVGTRDAGVASEFLYDLSQRLSNRVQLTSDGHRAYLEAADYAFSGDIAYAMLVKLYGADRPEEARYSPAVCIGCKTNVITGSPDPKHISTSYVERQNLTMRMSMRRFTGLTNAFSKKIENHIAALAVYFMYYNFVRIHQTLRVSPAMAAGVTSTLWSVHDIVKLVEAREAQAQTAEKSN
jgi:IS1 family transposase